MGRKRTPCEFCAEDSVLTEDRRNVFIAIESYPDSGLIGITVQGKGDDGETTSEDCYELPFYFCPECGRRLGY